MSKELTHTATTRLNRDLFIFIVPIIANEIMPLPRRVRRDFFPVTEKCEKSSRRSRILQQNQDKFYPTRTVGPIRASSILARRRRESSLYSLAWIIHEAPVVKGA